MTCIFTSLRVRMISEGKENPIMFSLVFDILIKWPLMFVLGPIGLLF